MITCEFVWTNNDVYSGVKKESETVLSECLDHFSAENDLCHAGPPEVNIASSYPYGRHLDAVIVCSCGVPRATLGRQAHDRNLWKYTRLTTS